MATTRSTGALRPFDPDFSLDDPLPIFARLRAEDPVHRLDERTWALLRHADIARVSRDPRTFCSGRGVLPLDRSREIAVEDSILYMDPPAHLRHRRLVSAAFHPRRVADLEPRIRELATSLLDEIDPSRPIDFVDAVAAPLPAMVIAEALGIPREDWPSFRVWSDAMIDAATEMTPETWASAAQVFQYFAQVIADREARPGEDLISALARAEVDGEKLSIQEMLGFCMTLLVAGNETTRNLVAGGTLTLAQHPDQRARLTSDPSLIPTGVEELLRWWTPVMVFGRTATSDLELRGQAIREGDFLLMFYRSANRDEEVFGETADQLDVGRAPNDHLAFGIAEHFCLGAGLARLEARILLEELLARFPAYELAGEPEHRRSVLMRGLVRLPLQLRP